MRENNIDDYVSKSEAIAIRAAIRKIENPAQVEAIARADKLSCARSAALELIKDERLLADILINERNEAVFEGAAARIKDPLLLAEIVLNAKTFVPMTKVLSRIDDQDILFRIACEAGNGFDRKLASARLDSEEALIQMLKSHAEASVRANIVEIIEDQSLIAETALRDPDHTVRESAVVRLTDQSVLAEVALKDPNEWIRYKAVRKLTDQSVLAEIALNDSGEWVRSEAVKKLTDQSVLAEIIKAEPEAHIRKEAVRILTDEKILRSLALGDSDGDGNGGGENDSDNDGDGDCCGDNDCDGDGDGKSSGKRDESYDVRIIANLKRYNLDIHAYTEYTLTRKLIEITQEPAVLRDIAQNAAYEISFAALVKLSGIASGQGQLPETYSGRNLSLERQLSIIESANDESLRQAVLIKFAKIKTPREALVYRIRAAKLIYDPVEKEYAMKGIMKEIVLTDNANEARNLLSELADQESFAYLALNAKHPFMCKLAAEKLTDQALLKHVFAAGGGPVQRIVLSRITDEVFLLEAKGKTHGGGSE